MEIQVLSVAGVMQDMTIRPRVSFSSVYCLTAHWRQAPTLPRAGCQQKYGISRPRDRHACNRLSAPSTSSALPSTWIVAMVQSSSLARCQRAWLMESCYPCESTQPLTASSHEKRRARTLRLFKRLRADYDRPCQRRDGGADRRDTGFELWTEVFDCAAQRLHGARCVSTEGLARAEETDQTQQGLDVAWLAFTVLDGHQELDAPWQAIAARGAEATGFAGEELLHVAQQGHHVDAVVHRHGQAGPHTGAHLGDAAGVHL